MLGSLASSSCAAVAIANDIDDDDSDAAGALGYREEETGPKVLMQQQLISL